ncbi:MAG TPA: TonB-dependent receptor [Thermoanaerobaculia bacterium]|nr:TonB-dependent receptor [Thermoanaerobaculia bacterium]
MIVGVGLLIPISAASQTTGKIAGTIWDESNAAVPGVLVELSGPRLQGRRSAVTSVDGTYRFLGVPTGAYTISASLAGLAVVQTTAVVGTDATATIDLRLTLRASAEVTVFGVAPLVDATSTATGSRYPARILDRLPIGRNYADGVFVQPGTQADAGETPASALAISVYGATSAENLFLIDGINTTSVVKGTEGKDINNEFVEELEVKTGGYQAEYGRNTGAVINVITKSGGDEFHGGAFGYYNDTGMRAEPASGKPANYSTPPYSQTGDAQFLNYAYSKDVRQEFGLDLGGFLLKDRAWFFASYNRVQTNQTLEALDPNDRATFGSQFPRDTFQNRYSGKLTLHPLSSMTIVATSFSDAQTQLNLIGPTPTSLDPTTYAGRLDTGGPDYGARLNQLIGSFGLFTFQYARHSERSVTIPMGSSIPSILDYTISDSGVSYQKTGGFGLVLGPTSNNRSRRETYAGALSATIESLDLKIGGDYTRDTTSGATYYTGGQRLRIRPCQQFGASICDPSRAPFYTNSQGNTVQVFYQHESIAIGTQSDYRTADSAPFSAFTGRHSAFLQGQWTVVPALTVNLGVRYDTEGYHGDDPATGPFGAFSLTNQWAPRLGFAWDFMGNGSSKVFGSVGRFYYALPTDLNIRVFTANSQVQTFNYDPSSTAQDPHAPRREIFQRGNADGEPVDPGTRASYQDEATLGVEMALNPSLTVSLKGTYRALGRGLEDRCDLDYNVAPATCSIFNPGGSGPAASGGYPSCDGSGNPTDPNAGTCGLPGQPIGPSRRFFRGIELLAREQFSNGLWAQASLLYSSLTGNFSGVVMETTGETNPGINADYDYYQFTDNAFGRLELDRPLQARLDAVYEAPFGLSTGIGFYVRSGRPTSELGWFNNFYTSALNLVQRGSAGRLPTDYEMNLSLAYDLDVGAVTITPALYGFNLLNRQTPNNVVQAFNQNASFVTDPASPFYGQAGVEPGVGDCPASSAAPCSDNPDYRKVSQRIGPRLLRFGLKVTF